MTVFKYFLPVRFSRGVYDNQYIDLTTKINLLKTEVIEVMLYGCATWTIAPDKFGALREAHRGFLLRCLNKYTSTRQAPDYHMLPYHTVLEQTRCESIEATVMKRILLHAGQVVRMNDCLLYTSPSPRDKRQSRMPSSA